MSAMTGVSGPPDPDSPLVTLFSTKSFPPGLNTMRYNKADDLLAKASMTLDSAARTAVYRTLVNQVMTDLPLIPIFQDRLYLAHTDAVQGFVQNSLTTLQSYPVSKH
jgi:peptide/nickel transport system substrate-binding protein